MSDGKDVPRYSELPEVGPGKERCAWSVFPPKDELGTINFLTPDRIKKAATLVRKGKVFNLCLPLNLPDPPLTPRDPYQHKVFAIDRNWKDDVLNDLYMQVTSHWDGLGHLRYREFGFFGGAQDEDLERGRLGIDRWAQRGIVGRAVLLDVARYKESKGAPIAWDQRVSLGPRDLDETRAAQGVQLQPGDILLLRTGWMKSYLALDQAGRVTCAEALRRKLVCPGLDGGRDMAAWLWDHQISAIAADNVGVEAYPIDPQVGMLHTRILPLMGMAMGEIWDLEELAEDSANDKVYESMLVSVPLRLPKAIGSPANVVAIK